MCVYVGSEVILANLLSNQNSVSENELEVYCDKLKEFLTKEKSIDNVYINLNNHELESTLLIYNKEFRRFQGRFFVNEAINLHYFNDRFDSNISSALLSVAQSL